MEQNKLETQIKEKLNSREIQPTEMAWDRLNAMLSVAEPKDNDQVKMLINKFNWLYIAASFVGLLIISTVFFNQKEYTIDNKQNTVVIENTITKENSKNEIKSIKPEPHFSKTILKTATQPLVQIQKNHKTKVQHPMQHTQENVVNEIYTNNSTESIVEYNNTTPENTETLLASVEKNPNSSGKNPSVKINPTDLLNQVDSELQLSFRQKALNTITQKYKKAKEALVNRNNQQ